MRTRGHLFTALTHHRTHSRTIARTIARTDHRAHSPTTQARSMQFLHNVQARVQAQTSLQTG